MSDPFHIAARDWALLVLLSILWGSSFVFMEVALQEVPLFSIVLARAGLAAIALNILIAFRGRSLWQYRKHWRDFLIMGGVGIALPFSFIVWGQTHISASLAAILNATLPFFTLILTHFYTSDEKMNRLRVLALLVGFAGVITIIGPSALSIESNFYFLLGELSVVLAIFCYGVVIIYGRRFKPLGIPPLVAASGQMAAASMCMIPLIWLFDPAWDVLSISFEVQAALLGAGLLSTALAFYIWYGLLERIGSNNTSLVTFLIPVSTIVLGYFYLGERLELHQFAGMGLIIVGLALIDGRMIGRLSFKPM